MELPDDEHLEVTLSDPTRIGQPDREIPLAFYWSSLAPQPMPIVVLSHGGAFGQTDPRASLEAWAPVLAEHGYLAVAIAHTPRDDIERIVLTMNLGGTLPQCASSSIWAMTVRSTSAVSSPNWRSAAQLRPGTAGPISAPLPTWDTPLDPVR